MREAFYTDRERGVRTLLFLQNGDHDEILRTKDGISPLFHSKNQWALREAFCADRERGVRMLLFLQNGDHNDNSANDRWDLTTVLFTKPVGLEGGFLCR